MDRPKESSNRKLQLDINNIETALPVLHALSTKLRLEILREVGKGGYSVNELARMLNVPVSTAALNVQILEQAGLLVSEMKPGNRGMIKLCSQRVGGISVNLTPSDNPRKKIRKFEMPVGCYSIVSGVRPPCGLAGYEHNFEMDDMPGVFYHPRRFEAELLWMHSGIVEYRFPAAAAKNIDYLEISYETCSETRTYCNDYPSDLFAEVNGVRLGVWRCPGDFGGRRGFLNPDWWSDYNTQFGTLLTWRVDHTGTRLDNVPVSDVSLKDLKLNERDHIALRLGVTDENGVVGGMNLFGKHFGDYPQGIIMRYCESKEEN